MFSVPDDPSAKVSILTQQNIALSTAKTVIIFRNSTKDSLWLPWTIRLLLLLQFESELDAATQSALLFAADIVLCSRGHHKLRSA